MLVVVIPIFRPPLMRRRGPTLGIVILRKSRYQQYRTRRWRKFQKVKYDKPEERCAHRNWWWLVEHCWTRPPDLALTQLPDVFFYAQLLVPMVDATHGLVFEWNVTWRLAFLTAHLTFRFWADCYCRLCDPIVQCTRICDATWNTIVAAYLLSKWCLEDWNQREWDSSNWTKRREGFSDCRLGWLGSGARGPSPHRWQPAALGGQGTLRRAKHNWWFCDV